MKISRDQIDRCISDARGNHRSSTVSLPRNRSIDVVAEAKKRMSRIPEIREDQVIELRQRIDGDGYDISSSEIAEKLLGRMISDRLR